jgi:hypothetical protein
VFAAYLEHFLLPALSPGMLVVVDNVGAHQPDRIRELVAAAGCELVFLPAYLPDLSPIGGLQQDQGSGQGGRRARPGRPGRRDRRRPGGSHCG